MIISFFVLQMFLSITAFFFICNATMHIFYLIYFLHT